MFDWPVVAVNSHLLPDGRVLTWEEGGSAFLPDGRLLVTGGQSIRDLPHPRGNPHTNVFDYRDDSWRRVQDVRAGRWYPTTIALADGEMLTVGGNDDRGVTNTDVQVWKRGGGWRYLPRRKMSLYPGMFLAPSGEVSYAGPERQTMFLDTTTGRWRKGPVNRFIRADNIKTVPSVPYDGTVLTVGAMRIPRGYHSTALLLPDGRVLVAGTGNGAALDQRNAQLLSPPYLHRGPRPTIAGAPARVAYGERFAVSTPDAARVTAVRLVRLGAITHSFDMNTRLVTLESSRAGGGRSVTAPASGDLAPPGHYMLFLLDGAGVPSRAAIVQVGAGRAG